eukprot:4192575-Amphidinium_carterae.1
MFQMLTDTTPHPDDKFAHETKGLFLEGCRRLEDVKEATMHKQPPFERMPAEFRGLAAITRGALEKDHRVRPRAPRILLHPCFRRRTGHPLQDATNRDSGPLHSRHRLATDGMIVSDDGRLNPPDYIMKFRAEEQRRWVRNSSIDEGDEDDDGDPPSTIAPDKSLDTSYSEIDSESLLNTTGASLDSPAKSRQSRMSESLSGETVPTDAAPSEATKVSPNDASTQALVHPLWPCASAESSSLRSASRPRAHSTAESPTSPVAMADIRPRAQSNFEGMHGAVEEYIAGKQVLQRRPVLSAAQPVRTNLVSAHYSERGGGVAAQKEHMSAIAGRQRAMSEGRVNTTPIVNVVTRQRSQSSVGFADPN